MIEPSKQKRTLQRRRTDGTIQHLRTEKEFAERASRDKSQFLAVASHDLRQPIHALGLYIAALRRKTSGEEQLHLVEQIERSVDSISTLLNSLLDISRLDAGIVEPRMQVCDVSRMLDHLATEFRMEACAKSIRLVVRLSQCYVFSDPVLLERILRNLISNALRYTPSNGTVLVACRIRGDQLRIEVRDNGIGIDEVFHDRIFSDFFQLNQIVNVDNKGIGLGLAIVDRLAKLLGHGLELRSELNNGSLFALELPSASLVDCDSQPAAPYVKHLECATLTGKKILIVDDDPLVLESTATLLSSWGAEITAASTIDAVNCLLNAGYNCDLVISDYHLGRDETGLDVIKIVREKLGKSTPFTLISGDTRAEVQKMAHEGGYHLLFKPVRPAKLRSLVQFFLNDCVAPDLPEI
jgi:CheY-like chemotaxis protein